MKILSVLSAAYPNFQLTEETGELYVRLLSDLPYNKLQAAALSHISQSKFFPTIAELRSMANEIMPGERIPSPMEAWGEVIEQIRKVGHYGRPSWSHPVIEKTVRAFGWRDLCLSENVVADRAHFLRMYEQYAERVRQEQQMPEEVQRLVSGLVKSIDEATTPEIQERKPLRLLKPVE
ncbi:MAG: hypothetical protein GX262_13470 [Clostridia bacterium]|nr:hypothetical protein [Clostridia bacterium]